MVRFGKPHRKNKKIYKKYLTNNKKYTIIKVQRTEEERKMEEFINDYIGEEEWEAIQAYLNGEMEEQ